MCLHTTCIGARKRASNRFTCACRPRREQLFAIRPSESLEATFCNPLPGSPSPSVAAMGPSDKAVRVNCNHFAYHDRKNAVLHFKPVAEPIGFSTLTSLKDVRLQPCQSPLAGAIQSRRPQLRTSRFVHRAAAAAERTNKRAESNNACGNLHKKRGTCC